MFNLMDFIAHVAQQNQQATQAAPPPQEQPPMPMDPSMQAPQAQQQQAPGQNAMSGNSPFAQMMGALHGQDNHKKGLFSALLKMFM